MTYIIAYALALVAIIAMTLGGIEAATEGACAALERPALVRECQDR